MWAKKASASDPLMTCRKLLDDSRTGFASLAREESGGCLLIGQALSGMKVARAWSGLRCGTWEPVVRARGRPVERVWPAVVRGRESLKRLICEGLSTDADSRGGPPRGSDDAR